MLISFSGGAYISVLFFLKQKRLAVLYDGLVDFNIFGKPADFDKKNNKLNLYSIIFSYYVSLAIFFYGFISLMSIPKCEIYNQKFNLSAICGQFFPGKLPFVQLNRKPMKQVYFIYQYAVTSILLNGSAVVQFMTFETSSHIIVRIQHLKGLLKQVFDNQVNQKERLHFCIQYYNKISVFFNEHNACFTGCMGVHVVITGAVLGCLTNQLVNDWSLGAVVHLGGWFIALFVVCHGGQMISAEVYFIIFHKFILLFFFFKSVSISDAAYDSDWIQADIKLQKDFIFLLMRSQKAFNARAGNFGILSYALFIAVNI